MTETSEVPAPIKQPFICECGFQTTTAQALGRHRQAWSGKDEHPIYESLRTKLGRPPQSKKKRKAAVTIDKVLPAAKLEAAKKLSPSGKIKELKELVVKALDELAIYAEVQAEQLKDVTTERDRLAKDLNRLTGAYEAIKPKRLPT